MPSNFEPTPVAQPSLVERHHLLAGLLTLPNLLGQAGRVITADELFGDDRVAAAITRAAFNHFHEHADTPSLPTVRARVAGAMAERMAAELPVVEPTAVDQRLCEMFGVEGRDTAFLTDVLFRAVNYVRSNRIQRGVRMLPHGTAADVMQLREEVERSATDLGSLAGAPAHELWPADAYSFAVEETTATGVDFLDSALFMNGCQAAKTYGLEAPFGAGKSTLGSQIVTSTALLQSDRPAGQQGLSVYYVYESGYQSVMFRSLCQLSAVAESSLTAYFRGGRYPDLVLPDGTTALSALGRLKPYEVAFYDSQDIPERHRFGERERLERVRHLSPLIRILDMTANRSGYGLVSEIRGALQNLRQQTGMPIKMVVVDYLAKMVRNHLTTLTKSSDGDLKRYSDSAMDQLLRVATDFQTPVWVLQQQNGEANQKGGGKVAGHAHSSGSTAFAESLSACFVLGSPLKEQDETSPTHGLQQIVADKTRDGRPVAPKVVRQRSWDRCLEEVDGFGVLGGRIVMTNDWHDTATRVISRTPPLENPAEADSDD